MGRVISTQVKPINSEGLVTMSLLNTKRINERGLNVKSVVRSSELPAKLQSCFFFNLSKLRIKFSRMIKNIRSYFFYFGARNINTVTKARLGAPPTADVAVILVSMSEPRISYCAQGPHLLGSASLRSD
jgi:hypothetical protein